MSQSITINVFLCVLALSFEAVVPFHQPPVEWDCPYHEPYPNTSAIWNSLTGQARLVAPDADFSFQFYTVRLETLIAGDGFTGGWFRPVCRGLLTTDEDLVKLGEVACRSVGMIFVDLPPGVEDTGQWMNVPCPYYYPGNSSYDMNYSAVNINCHGDENNVEECDYYNYTTTTSAWCSFHMYSDVVFNCYLNETWSPSPAPTSTTTTTTTTTTTSTVYTPFAWVQGQSGNVRDAKVLDDDENDSIGPSARTTILGIGGGLVAMVAFVAAIAITRRRRAQQIVATQEKFDV